jgi:hypothetical protein
MHKAIPTGAHTYGVLDMVMARRKAGQWPLGKITQPARCSFASHGITQRLGIFPRTPFTASISSSSPSMAPTSFSGFHLPLPFFAYQLAISPSR